MFFKNLTFFRFPATLNFGGLVQHLTENPLKPVGSLELHSRGFISPFGRDSDEIAHQNGGCIWFTVGGEDRMLPTYVVNDLLEKKMAEFEQKEGRRPGGKTRKRIKEDLVHELLPRAFVKPSRVDAMLDVSHGILVVDTSSRKVAEQVVSELRHALGSFPALPINAEVAPRSIMTGWIAGEPLPEGLALGEEAILQDAADGGARWAATNQDLASSTEVESHLEAGKQVSRMGLSLDDHLSFTLGEDLVVRKLKFLDGAVDRLENTEREDLRAELDARFALMSGEVGRLFDVLERALKISKAEA